MSEGWERKQDEHHILSLETMSLRNNCHKKCALTPQQILDTAYKKLASSFTKGETRASIIYAIYKSIKTQTEYITWAVPDTEGGWDETFEANYRNHYDITNGPSDQCPGTRDHVKWRRHEAWCGVGTRQILSLQHILQCSILAPSSGFSFIGHISSHFIV